MSTDLAQRTQALQDALDAAGERLPADLAAQARAVVARTRERAGLSAEHTVVALAGSTGSGKSSLFNAIVGEDVAGVGVQRPTTSHALAMVTGDGAGPLLEWLEVGRRHELAVPPAGRPDAGWVLLDLPDHDSVVTEHRVRAERLVERADLLVWVVDPQKYADAALHERYLRPLAQERELVTVVVLNQVDRLAPADAQACVRDLRRLLAQDGLPGARVLAVSARTGQGLDELRTLLADAAARREAATRRWAADLAASGRAVLESLGDGPPRRGAPDAARLVDGLEAAAGVPVVVDAVRASARRDAAASTGWPVTRWVGRLRRDPLRRLGLRTPSARPDLARSSLPAASPSSSAAARTAVRDHVAAATAGLPDPWVLDARARTAASTSAITDALDQAVVGTRLDAERRPAWWRVVDVLQRALVVVAVVGLAWLGLLWAVGYLQLPEVGVPHWRQIPVPTLLLVGGLLTGLLLALVSRAVAALGARRRAARARRRLRRSVQDVADRLVVGPVAEVLADWRGARDAASRAAS
ncbi:GTPase family protein [Cellulomonas sp. HZM]|uniref:GTPase family protein n=1 Tax=Cellulomonas sp. HZM TaxID=1454010 RepID=UPI0004935AFB|nr:GTPase [Cellulomonas sp. HZM]